MRKKIALILFVFVLSACVNETIDEYYATGTVRLIREGNGFYGIVGDDGTKYEPLEIPASFRVDGKRVIIRFQERKDIQSTHAWGGMVIELISINETTN